MNTVESAASLFGSDDAGPDPFAALGSDEAEPTATQSNNGTPAESIFTEVNNTTDNVASSLFDGQDFSEGNVWSEQTSQDPYAYDASTYPQDSSTSAAYDAQQAQGWYDEQGQWQWYSSQPVDTAEHSNFYKTQATPSNSYDPYAPRAALDNAPLSTQQPQAQNYSAYEPPVSNTASTYAPTKTSISSQSPYSPYTPAVTSQVNNIGNSSSYSYTAASHSYTPIAQATPPAPPAPTTPSASVFRPKTSNAYDPPLPPPRASKRAVSAARPAARTASPAVGQQTYPVYDASTLPPPPPLPAQYAPHTTPQSANLYSSPPQVAGSSAPNQQDSNGWNSNGINNHYSAAASNYTTPNGSQTSTEGGAMSSLYQTPASSYAPLTPSTAPHSGLTDETPTPRQPSKDTNTGDSNSGQSYAQSAPPSQQSFDTSPSRVSEDWSSRDSAAEDYKNGYEVGSFPSAPLPAGGEHSFSPNQIRPASRGPSHADRTGSPAWSSSPRASPDIQRSRDTKSLSPPPPPSTYGAYRSNSYDPKSVNRAGSPVKEPVHSRNGSQSNGDPYSPPMQGASAYAPNNFAAAPRVSSPISNGSNVRSLGTSDPYAPKAPGQTFNEYEPSAHVTRAISPPAQNGYQVPPDPYAPNTQPTNIFDQKPAGAVSSPNLWQGSQPAVLDPYAPPSRSNGSYVSPGARDRSGSNGSLLHNAGQYVPQQSWQQQPYEAPQFGNHYSPAGTHDAYDGMPYDSSAGQEISLASATQTLYAPSPSLLGSNDPLGRTAARIPVFSFGFGGKLVTCFHGASALSTGFDVALSSRQSTDIQIRVLHKVIPESALDSSAATYPGPLFSDPGSPTNSLVRTTASQIKAKKARVTAYLDERANEIERGIGYLHPGSEDRRQADGKLVIVRLLKVMVEHDGHLTGSAQIDSAVRSALLPRLAESSPIAATDSSFGGFSPPIADAYSGLGLPTSDLGESPIAVSTLRPSALSKIQEFLLRGERRQAYHYALDERLWAHAMVIASSIDKDAWKEVVNEFLKSDLGMKEEGGRLPAFSRVKETSQPLTNGREWLRVAYSLFSGQGPAAVQELLPPNPLSRTTGGLQVPSPALSHITPMSPNFPSPDKTANIPVESLSKWPETAAVMVSSPMAPDTSAALTALGDYLVSNGWIEAAHACYLLSPITSPMGGLGSPSIRLVLLGSRSPHHWPSFHKDPDPVIFSEIAEFAMSLATPPKGQDSFHGLPHLQAYKLIRATSLAEIGHVDIAKRYCEAITSSLGRNSPYFSTNFMEQLRGLLERLTAVPHLDKSGSWIGGKMSKPSLDSIGGWLEGRLTKFIAGDGDNSPLPNQEFPQSDQPGVFSHYSTISSATTSASPSPQPTQINNNTLPGAPPRRSGSAMASHSTVSAYAPIDRASSAMEYSRPDLRKGPISPRIASASATTTTFAQAPSFGQAVNEYGAVGHVSNYSNDTVSPKSSLDTTNEEGSRGQDATWWGSSYEDASVPTPTASTFLKVDEPVSASSSGFISLMDDHSFSVSPSPAVSRQASSSYAEEVDEEDLGFGNSKKHNQKEEGNTAQSSEPSKTAAPVRPDIQPAQAAASSSSGSWLGRLWKRSDSTTPGPVKASLGDEMSLVYDKDLKKWINKKAGAEAAKPAAPPPPPSRAQTASPSRSNPMSSSSSNVVPPPARSASAIDLSVSPPSNRVAPRTRSNLVPSEPGTPPPPSPRPGSAASLAPPPPPGRPKSSASKKNIRSRYVDILQEGGGA